MRRLLTVVALVGCVPLAACGSDASRGSHTSPIPSATPPPVDLTLPTTINLGESTNLGASLSQPSSQAGVSWQQALAINDLHPEARLTGEVLADVTMPNDFYRGKRIENLTCWVYVFTFAKPIDPRTGGPIYRPSGAPSPTASPRPMAVWHMVAIVDASNGQFVRGFFTK